MPESILIICDFIEDKHRGKIQEVTKDWARTESLAQGAPREQIQEALDRASIVIGSLDARLLAASPARLFLCSSVGVEAYFGKGLEEKPGFTMCNAQGAMAIPMAEHCLALMFGLARRLHVCVRDQTRRRWQREADWQELCGSRICIVGLGGTGTELAKRCLALGLHVVGVRRDPSKPHEFAKELRSLADLPLVVGDADHVVATVPGGAATRQLFDRTVFSAMKRGARFYTVSRGSVTDEMALIDSLNAGELAGAGLDVFEDEPLPTESPLWGMPNVLITPHCAGLSNRLGDRLCDLFIANLTRFREGKALAQRVPLTGLL